MANNLQVFKNPEFGDVRTVMIDNEPWFVGKDAATALGYGDTNQAIRKHVDTEDKLTSRFDGTGQNRNMTIINESGLYSLIMASKLPNAKKFKRWVTSEVLPAIRKHGGYLTPEKIEEALLNPDTLIKLATQLKTEREARMQAEALNEANKPKVLFHDAVAGAKDFITVSDLAKLLKQNGVNTGRDRLYAWLRGNGYLMKSGLSKNMPTQRSMEAGWFIVQERAVPTPYGHKAVHTTYVTGKGQTYFVKKFLTQ